MGELDPRIRIRAPLRCDGIGRLDCAEDAESGVRLAVRWLPLDANGESAALACQKLPHHPTLPRIRQTGKVGASAYVAMDFPEGELLAAREGEVLSTDALKWIIAQIADALATIHSQGVFHGEMSAESILLVKPEKDEKAYLWDMPLVVANRLTDRRGEERLMHQLVRTAAYLAPERARGEKPTAASDVYALAAIACLAGGSPKPAAETTLGVVHQVALGLFRPAPPASMSEPHRGMLERMLSADPKARPSAQVVADVFSPPSNTPTLREMPAISWPPAAAAATVVPAAPSPRPSMPKGPSSWTAMPAVTGASPAAAVFKPSAPSAAPATVSPSASSKSGPTLRPVAIAPETPVQVVAPDAAPTPPAAPVMAELLKSSEALGAKPAPKPEVTAPVPAVVPVETAPVQPSPPKTAARPAPPMVEQPALVESHRLGDDEDDVPEASADDVVDTTAPAVDVKAALAETPVVPAPAVAPAAPAEQSVALSDNVRVTPELVDQGAKALSAAEAAQLKLKKYLPFVVGAAALVVVGVLAAVAISMASEPNVVVHRQPRPAVLAPQEAPANAAPATADDGADDEDLLATPTRAKRVHRTPVAAPAAKPAQDLAKAGTAPAAEKQVDSSLGVGERDPDLDDADAPLKRPMF